MAAWSVPVAELANSSVHRRHNVVVTLEAEVDRLYQLPLDQFTAARNALAKTLKGDDAKRVKALAKPTVVPWAVNQLYWRDRKTFDRLLKAGAALRDGQIAALGGRHVDVRRATEAHRAAVSEAVRNATALAAVNGASPQADQLARMLEAVSLSTGPVEGVGRFTELIQPSGFEALAGISINAGQSGGATAGSHVTSEHRIDPISPADRLRQDSGASRRSDGAKAEAGRHDRKAEAQRKREEARRAREAAEQRRTLEAAIKKAEHELSVAESVLARAGREVEQAEEALATVRARHQDALKGRDRARAALSHARQAASFGS